jgi:hypothetical protein
VSTSCQVEAVSGRIRRLLASPETRLERRLGPSEAALLILTSEVLYQLSYVGAGLL